MFLALVISTILLHGADEELTHAALSRGAVEKNPLARPFVQRRWLSRLTKCIGVGVILVCFWSLWDQSRPSLIPLLVLHHGVMSGVVINNTLVLHSFLKKEEESPRC